MKPDKQLELKLERVVSQPFRWLFIFKGDLRVSFWSEELMDQRLFEKRCLEELGFWPDSHKMMMMASVPGEQYGWRKYINQCLGIIEEKK